jgi:hypothetical protein
MKYPDDIVSVINNSFTLCRYVLSHQAGLFSLVFSGFPAFIDILNGFVFTIRYGFVGF